MLSQNGFERSVLTSLKAIEGTLTQDGSLHNHVSTIHPIIKETKGEIAIIKASHIAVVVMCVAITGLCAYLIYAVAHDIVPAVKDIRTKVDEVFSQAEQTESKVDHVIAEVEANTPLILGEIERRS